VSGWRDCCATSERVAIGCATALDAQIDTRAMAVVRQLKLKVQVMECLVLSNRTEMGKAPKNNNPLHRIVSRALRLLQVCTTVSGHRHEIVCAPKTFIY
jgi:hypothetical protein